MARGAEKSNRKRRQLHVVQQGRCYYCPESIGIYVRDKGEPVLEHYIPQSAGGRRVVLACKSCDKIKGMIHGPEFEAIIKDAVGAGVFNMAARQKIAAICKARNNILQKKHPPRIICERETRQRTKVFAQARNVSITEFPMLRSYAAAHAGRDRFIAEGEVTRASLPATGDRHYQAWTGKDRA